MNNLVIVVILALSVILLAGFIIAQDSPISDLITNETSDSNQGNDKEYIKSPNIELEDYNGNTVQLSDYNYIPMVVNSWASWCPFCKKELVEFANVQDKLAGKITIVAINRNESLGISKQYSDELSVTNRLTFLLDFDDSFYSSIGGFAMPETIFVNADGFIVKHKKGPITEQELIDMIGEYFSITI